MRYVKQVSIIWGFTMAGEILHSLLPLPVPAGVYGLFLLLGALVMGAVRLESVEGTGNFLMDTMTMMFIPATVGLMEYTEQIKEVFVPFAIIVAVSTVAVMAVTGRTAQAVIRFQERRAGAGARAGKAAVAEAGEAAARAGKTTSTRPEEAAPTDRKSVTEEDMTDAGDN